MSPTTSGCRVMSRRYDRERLGGECHADLCIFRSLAATLCSPDGPGCVPGESRRNAFRRNSRPRRRQTKEWRLEDDRPSGRQLSGLGRHRRSVSPALSKPRPLLGVGFASADNHRSPDNTLAHGRLRQQDRRQDRGRGRNWHTSAAESRPRYGHQKYHWDVSRNELARLTIDPGRPDAGRPDLKRNLFLLSLKAK